MFWAHISWERFRRQRLRLPPEPLQQASWVNCVTKRMGHLKLFCLTVSCPIQKVIPNTTFPSLQRSHTRTCQEQFNIVFYTANSGQLLSRQRGPVPPRPSQEKHCLHFIQQGSRLKEPHIQLQVPQPFWTLQTRMWSFSGQCF